MKTPINLGEKRSDSLGHTAAPEKPDAMHYPSFHYEGDDDLGLPDEGEMTIKFCKTHSTNSTNQDGKTHYCCTVEVREICDIDGDDDDEDDAPAHGADKSVSDLLDNLMKAHTASKEKD